MLIPDSGRPADLDFEDIKTTGDADTAMIWLASVLTDMETQLKDNKEPEAAWVRRIRTAQRRTTNLYHRILNKRNEMTGELALHQAFVISALAIGEADAILEDLKRRFPHLAHFDLNALRGPTQS